MKKVTGIGGIFFKAQNPEMLREWYKVHLGLNVDAYGTTFGWRSIDNPQEKGYTQWSPFQKDTQYFAPSTKDFMINYRVDDLLALVEELRKNNVIIIDEPTQFPYGIFVHILDCEGNAIELWQPHDNHYEEVIEGLTK